jgi:CheY-like chemotaxis protein
VKFTPKGGRVELTLRSYASAIELTVSDTGEGIAPEMLNTIFERFKQVEDGAARKHGGLGLGLAIVKHLVELHGGTVSARSDGIGHGATFVVRLPIAIAKLPTHEEDELAAAAPHDASISLAGTRLLVIDDEADGRAFLQALFEAHGAKVHVAGSAADALKIVESAPLDLVLSDIGMPHMDGYELMRKIRELPAEKGGGVRAVALTAYARAEDRMRALKAGFQSHVAKPVDAEELLAVVASLLGRITPTR